LPGGEGEGTSPRISTGPLCPFRKEDSTPNRDYNIEEVCWGVINQTQGGRQRRRSWGGKPRPARRRGEENLSKPKWAFVTKSIANKEENVLRDRGEKAITFKLELVKEGRGANPLSLYSLCEV